jgi:MFS transporter, UMF1 family
MVAAPASQAAERAVPDRIGRPGLAWALFEGGRNPYVVLCTIYVLAPYIASTVIGDPVEGQALIAEWNKTAALLGALTAPFLGAAADRAGTRKPLLALVVALMCPLIAALWFVAPGGALSITQIGFLITGIGLLFVWSEVLHNAMLPAQGPARMAPHVSGLGLALGNAVSVLLLVLVLVFVALPGQVDWPFVPAAPAFGLDPATHEPSRIVAPIAAGVFALLAIPLFLFANDGDRGVSWLKAAREGVAGVIGTIRRLKDHRNIAVFLGARMLFVDGKAAILIIGGVFAAGVMQWGLVEMLAYGVILSIFAVGGGFLGGWLDVTLGQKRALVLEISVTLIIGLAMASMGRGVIFLMPAADTPVWDGPVFRTLPELIYLALACVIAVTITACYASSRSMMAALAPKGMEGELFGLYAVAGTATAWLGPMLVEIFTRAFDSQRVGFASISILLAAGLAILLLVRQPAGRD